MEPQHEQIARIARAAGQDDLERLFGRRVDLVAKDGLHRVIRDQVLADAQVLYAA
jgi:predicted nucleotidyltransferase